MITEVLKTLYKSACREEKKCSVRISEERDMTISEPPFGFIIVTVPKLCPRE